jgi:two-component system response regulator
MSVMPEPDFILLVDDNPDDVDLAILALKRNHLDCDVVVARTGFEALKMLHGDDVLDPTLRILPKVVLLDINMPVMNGFDVLKALRAHPRTQALPVVILTSSREEQDIASGYANGANSYIRKPVDFANFTEAIKQLGMYWLVLNQSSGS